MRKTTLMILALFVSFMAFGQSNCTPNELYTINTESGLKLRQGPSVNLQVVTYVPAKEYVLLCSHLFVPATFEGIDGHWRRVRYKDSYGYMFDGFLQKAPENLVLIDSSWKAIDKTLLDSIKKIGDPKLAYEARLDSIIAYTDSLQRYNNDSLFRYDVNQKLYDDSVKVYQDSVQIHQIKLYNDSVRIFDSIAALPPPPKIEYQFAVETFNYCGSLENIDPELRWYGVYFDTKRNQYRIRKIEIQVVMSKYRLGTGVEFDIKCESGTPPHFMIGSKERMDTTLTFDLPLDYFGTNPDHLYPGQKTNIFAHKNTPDMFNFTLFATGNVTDVGICPEMTNYNLKLTGEMNDDLKVQNLSKLLESHGVCGMPKIYWFGDLNGDKYPDFILASLEKDKSYFTLFMSDTQDPKVLVRKAATWTYGKCE